ncbi:OB-fold nucleic acid binding domain-containing protein [Neobacillus drentensis]|uniref:OB-fold nucleic acid binding domain-containing protein n=1 Tax=Neobacillus drentensis TaxID=220684 RepID=UPI003000FEB1
MKTQLKFIIYAICLVIIIGAVAMYKNGLFTKEGSDKDKLPVEVKTASNVSTNQKSKTISIGEINKSMVNDHVSIIGEISNRRDHKNGHVFLTVKDSSGEILIPIFSDKNINSDDFVVGKQYLFSGNVDQYNGEVEIIPTSQTDIVPVISSTRIEEKDEGQIKSINGTIISKYAHPQGHTFLVVKTDGTGQELDIPLFNTLQPNPDDYPINSVVSIKGKVSIYKGKLQLIPNGLDDVAILKKGDDSAVQNVKLSDINTSNRGKMVITKGFVKEVVEKDGHLFFKLSDNGKEIKTVLFKADAQEIEGRKKRIFNAEKAQFEVKILGMVDVYDGELEVIIDKVLVD